MRLIKDPRAFQSEMSRQRSRGKTIGFVPTMGALHAGHASLVKAARKENDFVAVSIFVNPTQFGPKEDFKKYPRTLAADIKILENEKADYLFAPSPEAMYGPMDITRVDISAEDPAMNITDRLCGKSRPGHFQGVATVVAKLFNLALPHRVYFGAKDYQQCAVIKRMIHDLRFNLEFKMMPTFREKDGLAMSSRNRYLTPENRLRARSLSETLFWIRREVLAGRRSLAALRREGLKRLKPYVEKVDYLEIVDPETLVSLKKFQPKIAVLTACFVGKTRLIDNVIITAS